MLLVLPLPAECWIRKLLPGPSWRAPALDAGSHVHLIRVHGKMHQGSFLELEQRCAGIAIVLVLVDRVAPGLSCAGVFQLTGGHRQAVKGKDQVHGALVTGMAGDLAGNTQSHCTHSGPAFRD